MKRALIAAGAVALLLLTGCSGGGEQVNVAVNSATPVPAATGDAAAPLTAETSAADVSEARATPEAAFLSAIHKARAGKILSAKTQIPDATDAQLLDAGRRACELLAAGEAPESITVIEGETQDAAGYFTDSSAITGAASKTLCH